MGIKLKKERIKKDANFGVTTVSVQLNLLYLQNPLVSKFGRNFFSTIPKAPGVYLMKDDRGVLIYVGKAKNLRNRIRSYTYIKIGSCTNRKIIRLIHRVNSIEWEPALDEKSALIRENLLLRTYRPVFNILNTSPNTYLFAHLQLEETGIRFHLDMIQHKKYRNIYGAFKGIGITYRAQKALLRLLWASYNVCRSGFELPGILTNKKRLNHFLFEIPASMNMTERVQLYRGLKKFYNGTSKQILVNIVERLLLREDLAPFMGALLQQDINSTIEFYNRCANKNRNIKKKLKIREKLLPQNQIDDLLVLLKHNICNNS